MLVDELVMQPEIKQRLLDGQGLPIKWWNRKPKKKDRWKSINKSKKKIDGLTDMQQQIVNFVKRSGTCKGTEIANHVGYSPYNIIRLLKPLLENNHIRKLEDYKVYYCGDKPPETIKNKPVHVHCIERAKKLGTFTVKDFDDISKCSRYHVFAMVKEGYTRKKKNTGEVFDTWEWICD